MYTIINKQTLAPGIVRLRVAAPLVARGAKAGQFCMVRPHALGERIPLTLAGWSRAEGWIDIILQCMGASTRQIAELPVGGALADVAGPMGQPSHLDAKRAVCVGGGVGTAVLLSQIKALHEKGAVVNAIVGARNRDMVILEDELQTMVDRLIICTDDGSYGRAGLVTVALEELIASEPAFDLCLAIGPVRMMQAVANLTRPHNLPTMVSLNPIMIDGTGMCGGCRVSVGGQTRYACVDGPDFDGHLVDFDTLNLRLGAYRQQEQALLEAHICKLGGQ